MPDQPDYVLKWEFLTKETAQPHHSGKTLVCGHSSQQSGNPLNLQHTVCIDTYGYSTGWLTAMDVMSGALWQAKQSGKTRTGWISDY